MVPAHRLPSSINSSTPGVCSNNHFILEAEKYYRYCIEQKINDYRIFSNYGLILKNQGKFREAEILLKKTIQLNYILILRYYSILTM